MIGAPNHLDARRTGSRCGFTLIEMLLAIAIIGIMSALILASISNAAADSREVLSRQQQVVLQEALGAWIAANTSGTNSLASARTRYTAATTQTAKLALLQEYLHPQTYSHFADSNYTTSSQIRTDAMSKAGRYVQFTAWTTTNTPTVELLP
ncbi:MAG: type II secretion system protein [Terrimicrobiaceae bacterium]|nr:type II secretion system protein [Terrimicrobiaceae bacterium]